MSSMTSDELLGELYDKTLTGNGPDVLDLTREGLSRRARTGDPALRGAHPRT